VDAHAFTSSASQPIQDACPPRTEAHQGWAHLDGVSYGFVDNGFRALAVRSLSADHLYQICLSRAEGQQNIPNSLNFQTWEAWKVGNTSDSKASAAGYFRQDFVQACVHLGIICFFLVPDRNSASVRHECVAGSTCLLI
jgi:hypothetical protein